MVRWFIPVVPAIEHTVLLSAGPFRQPDWATEKKKKYSYTVVNSPFRGCLVSLAGRGKTIHFGIQGNQFNLSSFYTIFFLNIIHFLLKIFSHETNVILMFAFSFFNFQLIYVLIKKCLICNTIIIFRYCCWQHLFFVLNSVVSDNSFRISFVRTFLRSIADCRDIYSAENGTHIFPAESGRKHVMPLI